MKITLFTSQDLFGQSLGCYLSNQKAFGLVLHEANLVISAPIKEIQKSDIIIIDLVDFRRQQILIRAIRKQFPFKRILVMLGKIQVKQIESLMSIGINGLYDKQNDSSINFNQLIKTIVADERQFGVSLSPSLLNIVGSTNIIASKSSVKFSKRELDILPLICEQLNNKEIADRLGLNERTVESHRRRLLNKTHSKNIIGVVLHYLNN